MKCECCGLTVLPNEEVREYKCEETGRVFYVLETCARERDSYDGVSHAY